MLDISLAPFKIFERLIATKKPSTLVIDDDLVPLIKANLSTEGAFLLPVERLLEDHFFTPQSGPYFVVTRRDETDIKRRLRSCLARAGLYPEIYGAVHDLTAMSVTGAEELGRGGGDANHEALRTQPGFAIVCGPRSGSQHLARELTNHGFGKPLEHLRPPALTLMRDRVGGFDLSLWMGALMRYGTENGVFGTKLISHFLKDAYSLATPAETAMLDTLLRRLPLIYLIRTNKLMQALSRDRAKATGRYHLFDEKKRDDYRESSAVWDYDFERIKAEVQALSADEAFLHDLLVTRLGHEDLTVVAYETLDIGQVVATLEDRLATRARKRADTLATNLLRDERTQDFAAQFLKDYKKTYRVRQKKTHAALQVMVDPETLEIACNVAPDAVTLG